MRPFRRGPQLFWRTELNASKYYNIQKARHAAAGAEGRILPTFRPMETPDRHLLTLRNANLFGRAIKRSPPSNCEKSRRGVAPHSRRRRSP